MTDNCALDPKIETGLEQLAQDSDTSKKLNPKKENSSISVHWKGPLLVPMFVVCIVVSGENDKRIFFFFSTETKDKCSFTSDKVVFTSHLCKKLIEKHDVRKHLKTQFTATWKQFHWQLFRENNSMKIPI